MIKSEDNLGNSILFFLSVLPLIFQDLPLASFFGSIAKCPNLFIAPLIFLYLVAKNKKVEFYEISKYYATYSIATIITSIIMMIITVLFFTDGNLYVYTEYFPIKLVKAGFYNFLYFLTVYNLSILSRKVSLSFIQSTFQLFWLCLVLYGAAEIIHPNPIPFIHLTEFDEYQTRLILTSSEPSAAIMLFTIISIVVLALRFFRNSNKTLTFLIGILSLLILLGIGAKGGVFFIAISLIWTLRKNISWKLFLFAILIFIPLVFYISQIIVPLLLSDIENFTSVSTRTTTFIAGFESLYKFPIGQGYGTYLVFFPKMLLPIHQQLSSFLHIPFLDDELVEMVSSGLNLGIKAGIPHEIMLNGFCAIYFYFVLFRYYFKNVKKILKQEVKICLSFLGTFIFLDFAFAGIFDTAYIYLIPFVLLPLILNIESNMSISNISNDNSKINLQII